MKHILASSEIGVRSSGAYTGTWIDFTGPSISTRSGINNLFKITFCDSRPVRKCDLVMPDEARAMAREFGIPYYECSVLTYFGVNEVFENAIRAALIARRNQRFWMTNLKKVQRPLLQVRKKLIIAKTFLFYWIKGRGADSSPPRIQESSVHRIPISWKITLLNFTVNNIVISPPPLFGYKAHVWFLNSSLTVHHRISMCYYSKLWSLELIGLLIFVQN